MRHNHRPRRALHWAGICLASLVGPLTTQADEPDNLTEMPLVELLEVEIGLDDAFDLFGALVEDQKTSAATGRKQDASRAPAVVSVITAQDIEAMGARTVDEALESVPGLHVSTQASLQPVYIIRGIHSAFNPEVLVLINGEPLKGLENGDRGMGWRDMPVQSIARIEVMRGPGSAVHGADAFAGMINLITKTAQDIHGTEVGARAGSFGTYDTWVLHGGAYGGWDMVATVEAHTTDGMDGLIARDTQSMLDDAMGTDASLAPGPLQLRGTTVDARLDMSKHNWRARLGYRGQYDVGMGVGINQAIDPSGHFERDRFSADVIYHNPIASQNWEVTTQANYVLDNAGARDNWILPPGTMGGAYPNGMNGTLLAREQIAHVGLSAFYSGFKNHLVRLGSGYRYQDMYDVENWQNFGMDPNGVPILPSGPNVVLTDSPATPYPEAMRSHWYLFAQDTWSISSAWDLTLGLRYDDYSDFGHTLNPRAALVWQTAPGLTTKLLYGRAFRAPSFRELYVRNNPMFLDNPNLKPEIIQTWELALDWRVYDTLNLVVTPFYSRITDKIQLEFVTPEAPLQTYHNLGQQKAYGLEIETRWKINKKTSLLFNYSYAHSEMEGIQQEGRPEHDIYARVDRQLAGQHWYLNTQVNWIGQRERPERDPRADLDGYITVDMTVRHKDVQKKDPWHFALGVRNLFDVEVREPASPLISEDFPMAGRTWFAEIRYHFD